MASETDYPYPLTDAPCGMCGLGHYDGPPEAVALCMDCQDRLLDDERQDEHEEWEEADDYMGAEVGDVGGRW